MSYIGGASPPTMSATSPTPTSPRLRALDAARVLATFGIVWTHVSEGQALGDAWASLGRFGTSFYVIVAAIFVVQSAGRETPRSFIKEAAQRSKRLLLPFLVWSLIYSGFYASRGLGEGYGWVAISKWWGPLAGTAVHLWFLPFIFLWGLLGSLLARILLKRDPKTLTVVLVLLPPLIYWWCYRHLFLDLSRPWLWKWHLHRLDRWIVEVPPYLTALLAAVLVFRLPPGTRARLSQSPLTLTAMGLVGFLGAQFLYAQNVDAIFRTTLSAGRFMANISGAFLLLFFLGSERRAWLARLAPLGKYTYGAFLSHMLFIEFGRQPIKEVSGYGSPWLACLCSVLVFMASLGLSWLIQQTRLLRWLRP